MAEQLPDQKPISNLVVFGFCELWGLAFGFPPAEDLYHGVAVNPRMVTFMAIGSAFAILGPTWPLIKTTIPRAFSATFTKAASDFRWWLVALVLIFVFVWGPQIYQRAMSSGQSSEPLFTQSQVTAKIAAAVAPLNSKISQLQAALADMTRQRDSALIQKPSRPLPLPSPISGPITWSPDLTAWNTGDNEGPLLLGIGVRGITSGFADLKDAYIISDVTGEKKTLEVSTAPGPQLSPISQINQIPPGAPVELWAAFKPPGIRPNDLLTQWHTFHFHAEYSGIVYDRVFDVTALANQFPNMGPHITKKVPSK